MQAVILAGGKGTRLKPYTTVFPKPLMPVGNYPILEIVIRQLKHAGFNHITMAVGHLKELIQAFFNDGSAWDLKIDYSFEDKPLGTAAPLKMIHDFQDNFLVMNGDVLTDLDYKSFFEYHVSNNNLCTIASYRKPVKIDLGVLDVSETNELKDYIEKPTLNYLVSMGVYAFNKKVLDDIPDNSYFDFPDLVKALLAKNKSVFAYPFDGLWLDIGRPSDYEDAVNIFESNIDRFIKDI